jgi:DMSO/TMAO reductase YedYZ molybdopterin-dependent catalytic subunit
LKNKNFNKSVFLTVILTILSVFLLILSLTGCHEGKKVAEKPNQSISNDEIGVDNSVTIQTSSQIPTYTPMTVPEIEGLHVTGSLIEIKISSYRFKITGLVENELSLTFDEVKAMPSVRLFAVLDCPGFFTDEGYWKGVEIKYLLEKAGIKKHEAKSLYISDYEGSYTQTIDINKVDQEGFLVAYEFNDKEFLPVHGFPLRIVAKGEPGNIWVKWLGEIEVR